MIQQEELIKDVKHDHLSYCAIRDPRSAKS